MITRNGLFAVLPEDLIDLDNPLDSIRKQFISTSGKLYIRHMKMSILWHKA